MTPEQITAITSIISLAQTLTTWPVLGLFFLMVVGPWVMAIFIAQGNQKRFEAVVEMYKNNVKLVEKYEALSKDLREVVMVNTQTFSTLTEAIKHNQFCPIVRKEGGIN